MGAAVLSSEKSAVCCIETAVITAKLLCEEKETKKEGIRNAEERHTASNSGKTS